MTIKIEAGIHQDWLLWMQQTHIPSFMQSGKFTGHQLLRLREIDDTDGPTYALQLFAESKAQYNGFIELHLRDLQAAQNRRWGQKMLCFSTLMEIVH